MSFFKTAVAVTVSAVLLVGCGGNGNPGGSGDGEGNGTEPWTPPGVNYGEPLAYGGRQYKTVKIGGQTWMAENLNHTPSSGVSWCYRNSADSCNKYGRMYDWNTAKAVCPAGWHLPTRQEWGVLASAAGGGTASAKLKSRSGWYNSGNGTDVFGFSALPGGLRSVDGYFYDAGYSGHWWSVTEAGGGYAYIHGMYFNFNFVNEDYGSKDYGFSVRCVKE